ncbi:MAG: Holliday junction branch migration protein RuvA [Pseudomonadota bacterium]
MIAYLEGILKRKRPQSLIVDITGVGYEVHAPLSTFYELPDENEPVSLHIYTHVREDALILFGFKTTLEKDLFLMLISVSGIGPKLALNVLSGIGPDELLQAVARGDAPRLQTIPGVGKKTAERIALELRDKASKLGEELEIPQVHSLRGEGKKIAEDAVSALANLGYPVKSAQRAVETALSGSEHMELEGLIKEALRMLA